MVTKDEFTKKILQMQEEKKKREQNAEKDTKLYFQDRWRRRQAKWSKRQGK